ncbi:serine hydrolase domain-containing protein [Agromyces bracchium]|uniref:Serine hydrolase n=2 Tax=Agromyces bracchium TaxID=88376 RepID=A0A6I3M479_9MICO|nr:serine hydrolase domain-containing protein [Agromyces bracchium]MTH66892.1 serine hydrolase [Agromyces bracchium]
MLGLLAVLTLGLSGASPASAPDNTSIDAFIAQEMPVAGVPGLAYAVVEDGEVSAVGAHGVVRAGSDVDVTTDTPFLSGSISKSFTALAVMQLVEAGSIGLDERLSRHLADFDGQPAGDITIRELLSHTSGYSTLQGNASHTDTGGGTDELARIVDALAAVAPAHAPGERWEYSNTNYQILGRVIEVASGEEYQAYVEENLLDPIGMIDSFVADGGTYDTMATGHRPWFWTKLPLSENTTDRTTAPQGGIIASATDLARYLQTMMNGEDDILTAENKALMMRPASTASPFYGLGWFIDSDNGTVWHSGATPGNETLATMMPTENRAVVVLVNGGSGMGFGETTELRNGITARALDLEYDGEGSRWFQQITFIALVLSPFAYLFSMIWAWRRREQLRAKTGFAGTFSLWFPLLTTVVAAWVIVSLVPGLLGSPIGTIALFQPDLGLALIATAIMGVLWAVFRLGVAYTGRSSRQRRDGAKAGTEDQPETITDASAAVDGAEPHEVIGRARP